MSSRRCGESRQALEPATAPPFAQWHRRCKSGDAHPSDPAVGGIAPVRLNAFILRCRKIVAQRCYPAFDMAGCCQRDVAPAPAKSSRTTGFQNPEGGRAMMEPIQCTEVFTQAGRGSWSATEKTARRSILAQWLWATAELREAPLLP